MYGYSGYALIKVAAAECFGLVFIQGVEALECLETIVPSRGANAGGNDTGEV